jgi:hypothetical protein
LSDDDVGSIPVCATATTRFGAHASRPARSMP